MEYDETARLKKRYKNEGLLGDAELSGLKSLLQTKIAPESVGGRSLLDVLQSVSNMSAENVSAPVEGIAWLLEKAGMPIKDPVLGQKWMADKGLTRPVKEGAQKVIGDAAGMLLPFAGTKAGAQAIAKGLLDIGENGLPVGLSIKDVGKTAPQDLLTSVNPTGSVFTEYTPQIRATQPLSKNMVSLAETMGANPDELITIYRGAPSSQKTIVPGDFITDNPQLAKDYAGSGKVIQMKVRRGDVLDQLDEPLGGEYIYRPRK